MGTAGWNNSDNACPAGPGPKVITNNKLNKLNNVGGSQTELLSAMLSNSFHVGLYTPVAPCNTSACWLCSQFAVEMLT